MNNREQVPSWHRPASQTGVPLFWITIGIIAGSFFTIFFAAVNPMSELLRLYTPMVGAAVGALGGGMVGLYSARRKDKLTFRRKTKAATLRIERICLQIEAVENAAKGFVGLPLNEIDAALEAAPLKPIVLYGMMLKRLTELGKNPPVFDDILETDEDVHNAMRVEELFTSMSYLVLEPVDGPFLEYELSREHLEKSIKSGMLQKLTEHRVTLKKMQA